MGKYKLIGALLLLGILCSCGKNPDNVTVQTGQEHIQVSEEEQQETAHTENNTFIHPELTEEYCWQQDTNTGRMILYAPDKDSHEHDLETDGHVCTQIEPFYLLSGDQIQFYDCPGYSYSIYYALFDQETYRYKVTGTVGWTDMKSSLIRIPEDTYVMIDFAFADQNTAETDDIDLSVSFTGDDLKQLEQRTFFRRNQDTQAYTAAEASEDRLLDEIEVMKLQTEVCRDGEMIPVDYVMIRIPRQLTDGTHVCPNVDMTGLISDDEDRTSKKYSEAQICRSALSPLIYSRVYPSAITLNAGLFNTGSLIPEGQTIVDQRILTNTPMTDDMGNPIDKDSSCYALMIDAEGDLSTTFDRTEDALEMAASGTEDAVTAWGCFVYEGEKVPDERFHEIVHGDEYARQVIGINEAYYFVLTTNMDNKKRGLTYDELAQIMIDAGAEFAFSLDSGGSTATCVGQEQITTIFEGEFGRRVPTVIRFNLDQKETGDSGE